MKQVLIKMLIFSTIIILSAFSFQSLFDSIIRNMKSDEEAVWNDIFQNNIQSELIILGSSRSATHINTKLLEKSSFLKAYNLGIMGHNFYLSSLRYNLFKKHQNTPKYIIISLDYESFQKRNDLFNATQFLGYLNDSMIKSYTKNYEGFGKYDYDLPILKYAGEQLYIRKLLTLKMHPETNVPNRYRGFMGRPGSWGKNQEQVLYNLKPFSITNDSISINELNQFLNHIKSQHIKTAWVFSPVHIEGQSKVINRKEIIHFMQQFTSENDLLFLDYTKDSTFCKDKKWFLNSTHLNQKGADAFTLQLIHNLQSINFWDND
jgi:hypothetical protein